MRECKSLAEQGYEVTVIAYWMEDLKEDEFQDGYTIKRLRLKTKSWTNNSIVQVFKYLEFLFKSLLTINKIKPNILTLLLILFTLFSFLSIWDEGIFT